MVALFLFRPHTKPNRKKLMSQMWAALRIGSLPANHIQSEHRPKAPQSGFLPCLPCFFGMTDQLNVVSLGGAFLPLSIPALATFIRKGRTEVRNIESYWIVRFSTFHSALRAKAPQWVLLARGALFVPTELLWHGRVSGRVEKRTVLCRMWYSVFGLLDTSQSKLYNFRSKSTLFRPNRTLLKSNLTLF